MSSIEFIQSKILNAESLEKKLDLWRFQNKKIVFTNGCFDLLHPGHIRVLTEASDLGDVLIVGLNSDQSIKGLKGESRPVLNENDRALLLASLHVVDGVIIFNEPTPEQLIKTITPKILVKGGDYIAERVAGYNWVTQHGGEVKIISLLEGYSTTLVIEKKSKL